MPESVELAQLRHDVIRLGEAISALVLDLRVTKDAFFEFRSDVETSIKVQAVEERHLDNRLDRIEESISTLNSLGKWILLAFGGSFITAVASFIIKGGLFVQ